MSKDVKEPTLEERVTTLEASQEDDRRANANDLKALRHQLGLHGRILSNLGVTLPPEPKKKEKPAILPDAPKCPNHPDAPQTANGCTVAGCTFSPATAPAPAPATAPADSPKH